MTDFRILRKCIVSSIMITIRFGCSASVNDDNEEESNFNGFIIGNWEHRSTTL